MGTQELILPGPVAFFPEHLNFDLLNQNDSENNDDDIKKNRSLRWSRVWPGFFQNPR